MHNFVLVQGELGSSSRYCDRDSCFLFGDQYLMVASSPSEDADPPPSVARRAAFVVGRRWPRCWRWSPALTLFVHPEEARLDGRTHGDDSCSCDLVGRRLVIASPARGGHF
jgi:hypothetical protein